MLSKAKFNAPNKSSYDVVIIGGAKIGSAIAWFLTRNSGFDGSILVIEKDASYQFSSTAHTNSCMRQQFSSEINVRISQFAADYVKDFQHYFNSDPRVPPIYFHSFGYLYLADTKPFADALRAAQKVQSRCGAGTKVMSPQEIQQNYPFYCLDDVILGSHNLIDEGYYDGNTVFDWWRRSAREYGVEYLDNEVVDITQNARGDRVETLVLATGDEVSCGNVVNATGPRAAVTARMLGVDIPVEPRKRYSYIFKAAKPLNCDLPLTIDPSGVHFRSDGTNYLAGCAPDNDLAVDYDDFVQDYSLWEDKVWPAIAARVPQFEEIKLINSWVGHYAFNSFDQNAILGAHNQIENFIFANGFSGHGFQQAPAVGRGISELIAHGEYRSLDLTPFDFSRIKKKQPFIERAVI
jgi:glycine/D-amino acid oxidase-like deaminating enzyme